MINRAHTRTDALNLTNVWDNVSVANNQAYWHDGSNRLQNADGPWGTKVFYYDGVGNRIEERSTPPGGALTVDSYGYPATSNRLVQITRGTQTVRTLAYDTAGNLTSDSGAMGSRSYVYNGRNRLSQATVGALQWGYTYNALEQLIIRTRVGAMPAEVTHYVHDQWGNVIAEADGSTGSSAREYIWLAEAEIAPTAGSRTTVDRPIAVVDGVNTAAPALWYVHVDHLHRPIKMTNAVKASVWDAVWLPWGGVHAITGPATLDARFPGQWFQAETGLHYNWHRSYDPTIGRYTQPDPLGFVDGPSVYGYARGAPQQDIDLDGRQVADGIRIGGSIGGWPGAIAGGAIGTGILYCQLNPEACRKFKDMCMQMAMGGRRQNIENEYSREARKYPDPCEWLKEQYNKATDSQ